MVKRTTVAVVVILLLLGVLAAGVAGLPPSGWPTATPLPTCEPEKSWFAIGECKMGEVSTPEYVWRKVLVPVVFE